MNKIFLRIICLIFVLIIAVSAFSACSGKGDEDVSSVSSKNNGSSVIKPADDDTNDDDDNNNDEVSSNEGVDTSEPSDTTDIIDDPYEDLEQDNADDEEDYSGMLTATLNIYNAKPVQEDFMGFGGVYHGFPYRKDMYGRQYTEKMAEFEIQRAINSGITMASSHYEIPHAWDEKSKSWNWESEEMQAMYKFCLGLKKGNVEVLVNHWYSSNFLFTTYPWRDAKPEGHQGTGHESIAVPGDQQKTLENFAIFMSETVKQFRAHGCTNMTTISIATEPYAAWNEEWSDIITEDEIKNAAAKDLAAALNILNKRLKTDGIRDVIDVMGPNFAGTEDAALYYKYFKKYIDPDSCDLISLHKYFGSDLTSDNYDLWKECTEVYKTQVPSFENFIWDEYNCSPSVENSIEYRHSPYNGIQLALAQVCFMNYGMKGSFIWSLFDQQWPDNSTTSTDSFKDGVHMCGVAPTLLQSSIVFAPYYSFSLVANALGEKGSKVYRGDDDTYEGVYAAMTENKDGELSIVVVSTNIEDTAFELKFEKSLQGKTFYRHVYNPNDITCTAEGELIVPDLKLTNATTVLKDVIAPYCVAVYTTKQLSK